MKGYVVFVILTLYSLISILSGIKTLIKVENLTQVS